MSKIEIPPLPEPLVNTDARINGEWKRWELYDKPQLHARDRQIVELCASIADNTVIAEGTHDYNGGAGTMTNTIVAAIRSLLNEPEGGC